MVFLLGNKHKDAQKGPALVRAAGSVQQWPMFLSPSGTAPLHSQYCIWVGYFISHAQALSHVRLFATPWTVARQAPLSTGFPRQEHWSGLPVPSPGDLTKLGIEPASPASPTSQAVSLLLSCWGGPYFILFFLKKLESCSQAGNNCGGEAARSGLAGLLPLWFALL